MKASTPRALVRHMLPSLLLSTLVFAAGGRHLINKISIPGDYGWAT